MADVILIDEVRTWLQECTLIDANDRFNANYLGADPTEYTIEDVPVVAVLKQYLGGALKQKNYMIASRNSYGVDILDNIANSGFYDALSDWVQAQNKARNFPNMGENKTVRNIKTTSTAYIFEAGADTARYQIPLQITYYEKEV